MNTAHKVSLGSLLVALGIIYGDIGTSPLYVYKAIVGEKEISEQLVRGGVSLIFWTLAIQTSIKYIWITLKADNHGEGGIFSLYALVKRLGTKLTIPAIIGAASLLADGMITPPISVSSAIEGLHMIPALSEIPTVPIVLIIITGLFMFQRFGTQKVGKLFGPTMFIWFTMLLILGIYNVSKDFTILKSLSPFYGYELLTKYPKGFWILGAVFLATTGAEALYSDLGHCGKENIRLTWGFVKISLVLNYLGQANWLLNDAGQFLDGRNPFFAIMPSWFVIIGIIIATLAAIIASQALISGSYTLINEAMNLNFWPRVDVRQPTDIKGQIFIPSINLILWAGCVFIVLYFQKSEHMEAAYGLAITLAMLSTTILLYFYLRYRIKWNPIFTAILISFFILIELSFLVANIVKITHGGYIALIVSGIFGSIMYLIFYGRKTINRLTSFESVLAKTQIIDELSHDDIVPKFSTHLIYMTKSSSNDIIEKNIIESIFAKKPKRADVYWFFHISRTNSPYDLSYNVTEILDDKVIKINLQIGFRVRPRTEACFKRIVQDLVENKELNLHIRPDGSTKYNGTPDFKFVILENFISAENEFLFNEGLLLNAYFMLKRISQSDENAFGLDRNDVIVEQMPLIYKPIDNLPLKRIFK
ncbi:MAG: KUP/HAK/KT family potassium transporter [Chitinophagales bacterium]|jgi:KUP system potassium uptake protein|nr:KUP/HAK/KT family potassium transporter [Chitinophagales bacterium]